jgi:putative selenium metabolism protein SsnA
VTLGSPSRILYDGAILIEGDRIADLGPSSELEQRYLQVERLDARGQLVMPGSICAHTHFYGAFARGMAVPGEPAKNFVEILQKLWWRLDCALTREDCRYSALVCLVDAIRHGTTTLIDHHASPKAIDGSLDIIGEAVRQSGLRACLCYEVTDRNGVEGAKAGIRENVRFIKKSQASSLKSHIAATFGVHALLTVSDETLEECVSEAKSLGVGLHLHVAEDKADQDDSLKQHNLRVVERLEKHGALGELTIAAHCVHIDAYEMELLQRTRAKVAHNPRSNMNNAVGVADVLGMLRRGITVGLGNDGFSNNMFTEMTTAYLMHKLAQRDPRAMGADQVLAMAYANNARIANLFFPEPLGELKVGAYADVILLDYVPYTALTSDNFPRHVIFGVDGSQVTTTICGGRILMRDRKLLTLDEEAIAARARELANKMWARIG